MNAAPSPEPLRRRWQPLRLGLVDLFRYDSEEFHFRDGHLLLRGNNGTGKSKVLSLTLPLLLDANLRSSRVEPDGDPGKRMAWNLLMGDRYERRTGYSWIEFGRLHDDGQPEYLTLGLGMQAVAARGQQVDAPWYFVAGSGARIGRGLSLVNASQQVLGKDRLRDALGVHGVVHENAHSYRRAVDERLFQLGERRYDALLDTLIQLRQPQLSRRPDESALSTALTESLPPLPQELLAVVAEAFTQLEDLRLNLERLQQLHKAVQAFESRYRSYAGMASRRQARVLRQAQTEFDNASRVRAVALAERDTAQQAETAAQRHQQRVDTMLSGARRRHEVLLADPRNADATRLQQAAELAHQRDSDAGRAQADLLAAARGVADETMLLTQAQARSGAAEAALALARSGAAASARPSGLDAALADHPWVSAPAQTLLLAEARQTEDADRALLALPGTRRVQLRTVRKRLQEAGLRHSEARPLRLALEERQAETEEATQAMAAAEQAAYDAAALHQAQWAAHLQALQQMQLAVDDVLATLAAWVEEPQGEDPARLALQTAHATAQQRLAQQQAALDGERNALDAAVATLTVERQGLLSGVEIGPDAPPWRGADTRSSPGAALWQLVDFAPGVSAAQQAGLETALRAAGLLDAWITPGGDVLHRGGADKPWFDQQWLPRAARPPQALAAWLRPVADDLAGVDAALVERLLQAVACSDSDDVSSEAWVSGDGRFRLAGLAGAAAVRPARHIGHAARQAARAARLAEIDSRLDELATEMSGLQQRDKTLALRARRVADEWHQAPAADAVRRAHDATGARLIDFRRAQQREVQAQAAAQRAEQAAQQAAAALQRDATDLRLPSTADELDAVELAVQSCGDALHALIAAVQLWRAAAPALLQQQRRLDQAKAQQLQREDRLAQCQRWAEQARATLATLEATVGIDARALQASLAQARQRVDQLEALLRQRGETLRQASEARARADQRAADAEQRAQRATAARADQVERLRRFTATGLLASGLAGQPAAADVPDAASAWAVEPALALARRVEQALSALDDDDERWQRAQRAVSQDLTDLQTALAALGERASAATTDFGFCVFVHWQQRELLPQALAAQLQADVQAQEHLLSAREREVLENHLQSEIASQIQTLMRAAHQQVLSINTELHQRPTSTGVRFRLVWQALPEGQGAPAGLHAAREKLLHTHAGLWSADERRAFGALLQQRVQDERRHADGGSLLDLMGRALDYRQWHQFRVERWQDGHWRKLSGPASSGERALGLTVPLFAAVATFYASSPLAPRLILLDEAFAGIDEDARAHCMGLVHEFDLDFVITSEREWGCYAQLPGVAICHLQRREGIDAVHVSRWSWDGKARRLEPPLPRSVPPPPAELLNLDEHAAD